MIKYKSTRGSERRLSAASAIIAGIAEDKGLYVPESVPALPMDIEDMQKMNYKEIPLSDRFLTIIQMRK